MCIFFFLFEGACALKVWHLLLQHVENPVVYCARGRSLAFRRTRAKTPLFAVRAALRPNQYPGPQVLLRAEPMNDFSGTSIRDALRLSIRLVCTPESPWRDRFFFSCRCSGILHVHSDSRSVRFGDNRYASKEMSFVWSPVKKFRTWRLLWVALATAEKELGESPFAAAFDALL